MVEVGGHLQDCDQSANCVIVRFEFLVQDSNSVPQLGIFDVFQAVERSLVGVERVLQVLNKQVAVAKSCPRWAVF